MWVGTSETIRLLSYWKLYFDAPVYLQHFSCISSFYLNKDNEEKLKNKKWNEWLAGLIDGDDYFGFSRRVPPSPTRVRASFGARTLVRVKLWARTLVLAPNEAPLETTSGKKNFSSLEQWDINSREIMCDIGKSFNAPSNYIKRSKRDNLCILRETSSFNFDAPLYLKHFRCISSFSLNKDNEEKLKNKKWNEWLGGLIDGDGYFGISRRSGKKNYSSLEIVMDIRDQKCLHQIRHKYGGSVKSVSGDKALRYRLHHKKGLLNLISDINGEIRNPKRLSQLTKICNLYNIEVEYPKCLTYDNGWLAGFIDADGSIYINYQSHQIFITASHKNKELLVPLCEIYGGNIYLNSKKGNTFKWIIYKKDNVISIIDYFNKNKLKSEKMKRISLIKKYWDLKNMKAHKANINSPHGKLWKKFINNWTNYKKD